jgi:hypothetical protein
MRRTLENPFYAGRVHSGDIDVSGRHPALVSTELFQKVQEVLAAKHRNPAPRGRLPGFPLRGVAICAECRGHMTAEQHGRWGYYRCCRQSYRKSNCPARFCNADRAHNDMRRLLGRRPLDKAAIGTALDQLTAKEQTAEYEGRNLQDQERASLRLMEARLTEAFVAGDVSREVYRIQNAELRIWSDFH